MTAQQIDQLLQRAAENEAAGHVVVVFAKPVSATVRRQAREAGLDLLAYLGENAFFAAAIRAELDSDKLTLLNSMRSVRPIARNAKLHPLLVQGEIPEHAVVGRSDPADGGPAEDILAAYVLFHRDVPLLRGLQLVLQHRGFVRSELDIVNGLVIELPESELFRLADDDAVQWIEPPLPPFDVVNDNNRVAVQVDQAQEAPYGLDGGGVVVMIYDAGTGFAGHADFGGRLTARDSSGLHFHATHVAGTVGGSGSASGGLYRGMAPGVTLEAYGYEWGGGNGLLYTDPGDIIADYGDAINNHGAVLANNSIGSNVESNNLNCANQGDYGVTASVIDSVVRGDLGSPIRVVWAAGNERQGSDCDIEGFDDYYSVAPPACAKNHLTVGAMNSNDDSVTSFTSWGPCDDGRLKPDLSAAGCQSNADGGVTSCANDGGYDTFCGTSMASPTTCGAGALLLQDYRSQFPGSPDFLPSTMKVLMIQSAADLEAPGPDYQTGYGLVQIRDAIDLMRTAQFAELAISQGAVHSFDVQVDAGTAELRFTLAWDDFPATPNIIPSLVNDLDLRAISPSVQTSYPWTLNPNAPAAGAVQIQADHLNNIEQVVVASPEAGLWRVEVVGFNVPEGPQSYLLTGTPGFGVSVVAVGLGSQLPELIAPGEPLHVDAIVAVVNDTIISGSEKLLYRFGGGSFIEVPLTPDHGVYSATIPGAGCSATPEFYFSVEGEENGVVFGPPQGPDDPFTYAIGTLEVFFSDDFEKAQGWMVTNSFGLTDGAWSRGIPIGGGDRGDPPTDADGSGQCYLTDNVDGNSDVDNGSTTLTSPVMDASRGDPAISYYRWFSNTAGDSQFQDIFVVEVSDDGGSSWINLETVGPAGPEVSGGWFHKSFLLVDVPGLTLSDQFRVRFIASDTDPQSIVEAAVDGIELSSIECEDPGIAGDFDFDGDVDAADLAALLSQWGPCAGCPEDLDGDGMVTASDLAILLSNWG